MEEIIKRLEACNRALEYAAYNYDGSIIEELEPNVIESTGVGTTCLIEIRNNNEMIKELRDGKNADAGENTLPIQRVSGSASENGSFCPECGKSSCNGNCY